MQATGWGKSAVYWMAARALRDAGAGPTLVVSPLLALMRNQVDAAALAGLSAATLNSSNFTEWGTIQADLAARSDRRAPHQPRATGQSPVRGGGPARGWCRGWACSSSTRRTASPAGGTTSDPTTGASPALLTARPELPVLATTATANARVTQDVAEQLGDDTLVLRGTLARESLHLSVLPRLGLVEAYAWVDQFLDALPGSGIVYASTVRTATDLAAHLRERGHDVRAYHGQLDTDQRERIEAELKANDLKAVIATSALGMGYDKPDLGFVVHVGSPGSPVDYYQQVGRAGRALDTAQVVLIPTPADEGIWRYFATASIPREEDAAAVLAALEEASEAISVPRLAAMTGVRDNRLELLVKVLAVEGALRRTQEGWLATGEPWTYDRPRYDALLAAREHEADLMRAYARSSRCLDSVLREALDDPSLDACGRCSACTASLPPGLSGQPGTEFVDAALAFVRGLDVELKPRAMWAPGLPWTGRIAPSLAISPGRALAFADDPAWPQAPALVAVPDAPVPDWVIEAVIAVLTRWRSDWADASDRRRPDAEHPAPATREKPGRCGRGGRATARHRRPAGDRSGKHRRSRGEGPCRVPGRPALPAAGRRPHRRGRPPGGRPLADRLDRHHRGGAAARGGRRRRAAARHPPAALGRRPRARSRPRG